MQTDQSCLKTLGFGFLWRGGTSNTIGIIKNLILILLGFFSFGEVQGKPAKVPARTLSNLNASIKNLHSMELVLKKFFKTPKDALEIDKDLKKLTKRKLNWHFSSRSGEIFLKQRKKTLFKFKLVSKGNKISDYVFNINGRKFVLGKNQSYLLTKNKLRKIIGNSKQSLLESLIIKEAHAFFPLLLPILGAAVVIWSSKATEASVAGEDTSTEEVEEIETPVADDESEDESSPSPSEGATQESADTDSSDGSSCDQQKKYNSCVEGLEWRTFDPGLNDTDECTSNNINNCALNLNYTHFKKAKANIEAYKETDEWEKCIGRQQDIKKIEESSAEEMCSRPGYLLLDKDPELMYLGKRLKHLVDHYGTYEEGENNFKTDRCNDFSKKDVDTSELTLAQEWGLKDTWAEKYCSAAKSAHDHCVEEATCNRNTEGEGEGVTTRPTGQQGTKNKGTISNQ